MTQKNKILGILRAKGSYGMNSYEFRMQFIQLPARISDLKKLGHKIVSVDQKNRSVNYILVSSPTKPVEASKPVGKHNAPSVHKSIVKSLKFMQLSFV